MPGEFGLGAEFYVQYGENAQGLEDLAMFVRGRPLSAGMTRSTGSSPLRRLRSLPRSPRRMVVLQGARITLGGVATGLVAALIFTRALDSLLYGVGAFDAPTLVSMAGLMLVVALLASYVPARRASSVDPMRSLRTEEGGRGSREPEQRQP
jgi:predicted lysophospholipase L1 biosynthesis ABC-type transport system permease subunit